MGKNKDKLAAGQDVWMLRRRDLLHLCCRCGKQEFCMFRKSEPFLDSSGKLNYHKTVLLELSDMRVMDQWKRGIV